MWSLGVTTYVLLTGFSPFGGETDQETFCNISQAQLDFPDELFEDVSEEAKDFIKRLLIRDPSERMSAKECLRHPWIMKHRKTPLTPAASRTNLQVEKPELSEGRGRVGCSSCSQTPNLNKRNLRKYLSKSREALFERVVSQHRLASELEKKENSLRKSTLLNQYNKTRRLCESQMNLISKSRERQLLCEQGLSPNFSKSREKLYGLRSLSKSHEVLNLGLCQRIKTTNDSGTKTAKPESKQHLTLPTPYSITHSNSTSKLEISNDITSVIGGCDKSKDADKENSLSPKSRRNSATEKEDQKDKPEVEAAPEVSVREGDADGDCHSSSTDSDDLSGSCENICDDQEPRFTVQQLISAYNLHQEVVTKTSLEVTMSLSDNQENKIIPTAILNTAENHKFLTGPNALRLFIPDIDIAMRRTRRRSSKTSSITTIEESVDEGKVPDAVLERLKDPSSSPSCSNPSTPTSPLTPEIKPSSPLDSSKPLKTSPESQPKEVASSLENLSSRRGSSTSVTSVTSVTTKRSHPPKLVRSLTESNVNRTHSSTSFLKTLDKFNNMIKEESKQKDVSPKQRRKSNPALMNKQYF